MANRIILNETSYHGQGAILSITEEAKLRGFKKAFVCSDPDLIKFNVTKKVTENNIKLGKDISVLGFDDIDALKMIGYNISVVSRDAGLQGEEAMELLQERFIKRDGIDGKQVMVPYKIILRGSEKCEK